MTQSPSNDEYFRWESVTSADFCQALEQIRTDDPPMDSVDKMMARVLNLDFEREAATDISVADSGISKTFWGRTPRQYAVVAAGLAAVILLSFSLVFQQSAWAQVVDAVAAKPWMRLTLQRSETAMPGDEFFDKAVMWFRGDSSVAAINSNQQTAWVDLVKRDKYEFQRQEARLTISKLGKSESSEIQSLMYALSPFQLKTGPSGDLRLTKRSEVTIDEKKYIDFLFSLRVDKEAAPADTLLVRVNKATMLPTQLTVRQARFEIDYPDSGPDDIYALNVPQKTVISDLRNLETYFRERVIPAHSNYEAVELTFFAWLEGKWLTEAARYHSVNSDTTCERADLQQVLTLSQERRAQSDAASIDWWAGQAASLGHDSVKVRGYNFPHNRCYMPYGGIELYESATVSTLKGLEGTIEVRGPKHSVWLDPNREFIVRRWETIGENDRIDVIQIDEVLQGPKGVWFSTRWRQGEVAERGSQLSHSADRANRPGAATTVHVARITFK